MTNVKAYCPGSISLIFKSCQTDNYLTTGSTGVGFTIDQGVLASVAKSEQTEIIFNGKPIIFPTVSQVVRSLTDVPLAVNIDSDLPLGFGFGLSGASSVAAALAINKYLKLCLSGEKLIEIAHRAEIDNHTGLGSVGTQTTGGFIVKTRPGIPFKGYSLPFAGKNIYAMVIGSIKTPSILKDENLLKKINLSADKALEMIASLKDKITLGQILDISYEYACQIGLPQKLGLDYLIEKIKKQGGHASMSMLGKVVISDVMSRGFGEDKTRKFTIIKDPAKIA